MVAQLATPRSDIGYDAASNRTSLNDSFGGAQASQYDALNRLTIRQHAGQAPVRFDQTYTPVGQLASVTRYADLAGTTVVGASAYGYDALGRTRTILHTGGGGAPLTTLDYDYDIASRLTAEDRDSILIGYGYDDKDQLTADGAGAYNYDAAGNRDLPGYQTGPGNRLQSDGTWTYTHDDEGNLVKKVEIATGLTWTFGYDHRNQLIWTERRTTEGGSLELRLDYRYDVFARRIEESRWELSTGTTALRFGYDGQDVLVDLDGANVLQVRYVRPDGIDALGARASASGLVAWYFTDLRGSVIALTDGSGVLRTEIAYDGFGNIVSETDPGFSDRHKYTGREWQEDLGWNYHRRRWYNPATGQWVTEDPIRITAGDYNYYRYAGNGATLSTDPWGLTEQPVTPQWIENAGLVSRYRRTLQRHHGQWVKDLLYGKREFGRHITATIANAEKWGSERDGGKQLAGAWRAVLDQLIRGPSDQELAAFLAASYNVYLERAGENARLGGFVQQLENYGVTKAFDRYLREKENGLGNALTASGFFLAYLARKDAALRAAIKRNTPSVRAPSTAEVQAQKALEAREATRAAIQRSLHRTMPFGPAPDWDLIHRVDRRYWAEDARRRAARSPEEKLYAFALEQVMLLGLDIAAGGFARLGRVGRAGAPIGTASAPGARVTIGGVQARELSRRLTTTEMAAIQRNSGREAAQIYLTGPGTNGGGGTYYLIQGTRGNVSIPLGPNVRWINHTHPAFHPSGAPVSLMSSEADRNVLRLLEQSGSPQRTSQIVPEIGQPFLFQKK